MVCQYWFQLTRIAVISLFLENIDKSFSLLRLNINANCSTINQLYVFHTDRNETVLWIEGYESHGLTFLKKVIVCNLLYSYKFFTKIALFKKVITRKL